MRLHFQIYDIDTADEADIILNGKKIFDVPITLNNQWSDNLNLLLSDTLINDSGINILVFDNMKNPPYALTWGVRKVAVQCAFQLPSIPAYGKIQGGDQMHVDRMVYCMPGQAGNRYLSFRAYDIDTKDEVAVFLNGTKVNNVIVTENNKWSGDLGVLLPDSLVNDSKPNSIIFDNTKNPPQSWVWGVRQVTVETCFQLPSTPAYGKVPSGDQTHADKVIYSFSGQPGDLKLSYEVYDIDNPSEMDILLNGVKIHDEAATADNNWSSKRALPLPDALIKDNEMNVLIFDNTNNPNNTWTWIWGVRNVGVTSNLTMAIPFIPPPEISIAGNQMQGAQYLLDGQTSQPERFDAAENAKADDNAAGKTTATKIAAQGHLLIRFPTIQKFDYILLYLEEKPLQWFHYLLETSLDGREWQTLIDKTATLVEGVQLDQIPSTKAQFLRISGWGYICDLESMQAEELNEENYWQAQEERIRKAVPTDLAIAELALFKQEPLATKQTEEKALPTKYALSQNFPNPFNPSTLIKFELPEPSQVTINIYNESGQLIRTLADTEMLAGRHTVRWNGRNQSGKIVAAGVYFYRIVVKDRNGKSVFTETKRMIFLK